MPDSISATQIAAASHNRKHARLTGLILIVVAVLVLVIILLVITRRSSSQLEEIEQAAGSPSSIIVEKEDPVNTGASSATIAGKTDKEYYEGLYATYLSESKNVVSVLQQVPWSQPRALDIEKDVANSLELFNAGDYDGASAKIGTAMGQTESLIKERDQQVEELVKNLDLAFEKQSLKSAERSIEAISQIYPGDGRLPEWKNRLSEMPDLIKATEGAHRARVENRMSDELTQLLVVDRLDPGAPEVTDRISQLMIMIGDEKYFYDIKKIRLALAKNDAATARRFLDKARSVRPSGQELPELTKQVDVLGREIDAAQYLKQAASAMKSDDWERAKRFFASALDRLPTDERANKGFELADRVFSAQQTFQVLLKNPLRLADGNVSQYARAQLESADDLMMISPSLDDMGSSLSKYLDLASTKREVLVLSDGKTTIKVQGVGYINPTSQRIVELKPGNYTLFAEREGFRGKIVHLSVPLEGEIGSVSIMCDERI